MEIIKIDGYLDGGTIKVVTNDEIYCIDSRINTKTKGKIYLGYPEDNNNNIVSNQDELKSEIKIAIKNYNDLTLNFDWKPMVYRLLN